MPGTWPTVLQSGEDTIWTNLLYARLDATQAEIEAAARAANIHHFIGDLPGGYDTVMGSAATA